MSEPDSKEVWKLTGTVFILPWLIVPAMNVKRTLRLGIYFTFLVGSINMAVSLVRFVMIWKAGADSTISLSTISKTLMHGD